jgi:hypothetical protein
MARLEDLMEFPFDIKGIDPKLVKGVRTDDDDREIILLNFERLFYAG